ncbi:phospholipase D-like domain-containing protein (plasmid) [Mycolicibacterium psychrotolerans]|uniref:phospholipase D-like domain-containing protein n=1 Tax=Mycolicibacterium psychrotolerans TaxID=216929 RepID=UPI003D67E417
MFFIHTKFLLIDPLSDDPLVCTGSANFSANSLLHNDENMLLIRGDIRVADIYLTEFDRIFRHFFARNAINKIAAGGEKLGAASSSTRHPSGATSSSSPTASNADGGRCSSPIRRRAG